MSRVARGALVAMAYFVLCAAAYGQQSTPPRIEFRLKSQPLSEAVTAWAQQAGLQLIWPTGTSATTRQVGPRVNGRYAPEEALNLLLEGSGLTYSFVDKQTVAIRTATAPATGQIGPVRGDAVRVATSEVLPLEHSVSVSSEQEQQKAGRPQSDVARKRVETLQEIVVTGTHIRGVAPTSPVIQITRQEIESSGVATTQQLLERLPQNFNGGITESTGTSFVPGGDEGNNVGFGAGVNLRGLGSDSTLVLLNGHRLSQTGAGNFVDVSQIPISAIERIDILTDGASAVYGSDAIGGVVNIVLRQDYDGAETRVRAGSVASGGPDEFGFDQSLGATWNGGNGLLSYDYYSRGELSREDRPFAQLPIGDLMPEQRRNSVLANVSHRISDGLKLSLDGLYSSRDSHFLYPQALSSTEPDRIKDSTADSLSLNASADIRLSGTWATQVSTLLSRSNVDWRRRSLINGSEDIERFRNELRSIDIKADGSLFSLPAGAVKAVIGAGYREEKYRDTIDNDPSRIDSDRDVTSFFGELLIPIVGPRPATEGPDQLQLSLAVRHERYSDLGATTDPKVGLSWSPTSDLKVRGTYSTSFRAPNFNESSSYLDSVFFLDFPDSNPNGSSLALYLAGADPDLKPEESTNWTFGLDYAPSTLKGANVSLTYFYVAFKERVQLPSNTIFDLLENDSVYGPVLTRQPTADQIATALAFSNDFNDFSGGQSTSNTQVIIDNRTQNLARTNVSGLDLTASYTVETRLGDWTGFLNGSRLVKFDNKITPTAGSKDILNTLFNPVDLRVRGGFDWARGPWSGRIAINYTGDYVNDTTTPASRISSWTVVDVGAAYQTKGNALSWVLSDISIRLSAQNLFNREPPKVISPTGPNSLVFPIGFDPTNANPLGRLVSIDFSKKW